MFSTIRFLFIHSGSTGKPKGCVHTTGGYMIYGTISFKYVFDYYPGDVFFSTGDIGWLTGHTYTVYGPLLNTATCILGGPLLTPMPFCTTLKPGCAAMPFFGVEPAIVDDDGNEIEGPGKGNLKIVQLTQLIRRVSALENKNPVCLLQEAKFSSPEERKLEAALFEIVQVQRR
ncbi:Acetyl-coenzyme A synthetase [Araneus ventricosus]|uniref:acetate--CoA ligase n=1 Tax=Araneus ventricosus TaxID=182803 RepID=A0A4Y2GE55_ARAVE|nr:Acetyl-coenzyme A synthetase [Araneus ventricosus]